MVKRLGNGEIKILGPFKEAVTVSTSFVVNYHKAPHPNFKEFLPFIIKFNRNMTQLSHAGKVR